MAAEEPALIKPVRDDLIDGLRGLAILGVVLIHVVARLPDALQSCAAWLDHAGRFGVPLFFAVSGAMVSRQQVHALAPPDSFTWLLRRLRVVAIPYLLWAVVYALLGAAPLAGGAEDADAIATRVIAVGLGYSAEHLWFMPAYLGLMLAVPPLVASARGVLGVRHGRWLLRGALLATAAAQVVMLWAVERHVSAAVAPPQWVALLLQSEGRIPLQWMGFFALGWLLDEARLWQRLAGARPAWLAIGAGGVAHVWVAARAPRSPQFDDFWCAPSMAIVTAAVLVWAPPLLAAGMRRAQRWPAWLGWCGRHSLPIYLAHVAGLVVVEIAAADDWLLHRGLWLAVAMLVATVLTWLAVWGHGRLFASATAIAAAQRG